MSTPVAVLVSFWAAICVVKFVVWLIIIANRRSHSVSGELPDDIDWPAVEIIVPAKNEEADLPGCLDAILAQDYPRLKVVVANDRSDDRTGEIAEEYAQRDSRVRVVHIEDLPAGWLGKAHAMWNAAASSKSEWLLFLDADVTLRENAIRLAVNEALNRNVQLLSLWPGMAKDNFWQSVMIPYCGAVLSLWFSPSRVNNPRCPTGFANGQFLLVRREAYEKIDGHRAVKDYLIEDVPIGQLAKKQGVPTAVVLAPQTSSLRMYKSLRGMMNGWARIYAGALRSCLKLGLTLGYLLASSLPFVIGPLLLIAAATGEVGTDGVLQSSEFQLLGGLCLLNLVLLALVNWQFWDAADCPKRYLWFYPLTLPLTILIVGRAFWWLLIGGRITWRGTRYRIDRAGRIVG